MLLILTTNKIVYFVTHEESLYENNPKYILYN